MFTEVTCSCLVEDDANVFLALMLVISEECVPCLPSSHARILLCLLPVSSFASCPSLPCSDARHHLVLTLVITPLSGSCLLWRSFQRGEGGAIRGIFEDISGLEMKIPQKNHNFCKLPFLFCNHLQLFLYL